MRTAAAIALRALIATAFALGLTFALAPGAEAAPTAPAISQQAALAAAVQAPATAAPAAPTPPAPCFGCTVPTNPNALSILTAAPVCTADPDDTQALSIFGGKGCVRTDPTTGKPEVKDGKITDPKQPEPSKNAAGQLCTLDPDGPDATPPSTDCYRNEPKDGKITCDPTQTACTQLATAAATAAAQPTTPTPATTPDPPQIADPNSQLCKDEQAGGIFNAACVAGMNAANGTTPPPAQDPDPLAKSRLLNPDRETCQAIQKQGTTVTGCKDGEVVPKTATTTDAAGGAGAASNACTRDPDAPATPGTCVRTNPQTGQPETPDGQVTDAPPADIIQGSNNTLPTTVDATTRSQAFLTGKVAAGAFDPAPYKAVYIQREYQAEVLGADLFKYPDIGDVVWGQLSDLAFSGYKYLIHAVITFIGFFVFGFLFISWLIRPALALAEQFRIKIIDPANLGMLAIIIAGIYAAFQFLQKRFGSAFTQYSASALILALGGLMVPGDAVRWLVSLVAGMSAVILMVGAGQDPSVVPAPSTAPVNTDQIMTAYNTFTAGLEDLFIKKMAQIVSFGDVLPDECQDAYQKGVDLHVTSNDPSFFQFLKEIPACKPFVAQAAIPDVDRFIFSGALALWAVIFSIIYVLMSWPAIKGQIGLMIGVALHKFLIIGAALPGHLRAASLRRIFQIVVGAFALVVLCIYLSLMLLSMNAILAATAEISMTWRLIAILLLPIAMLVLQWKHHKKQKSAVNRVAAKLSMRPAAHFERNSPGAFKTARRWRKNARSLTRTAVAIGSGVGGVALAADKITKKATTRVGKVLDKGQTLASRAAFGDETHNGVLLGKSRKPITPPKQPRKLNGQDAGTPSTTAPRAKAAPAVAETVAVSNMRPTSGRPGTGMRAAGKPADTPAPRTMPRNGRTADLARAGQRNRTTAATPTVRATAGAETASTTNLSADRKPTQIRQPRTAPVPFTERVQTGVAYRATAATTTGASKAYRATANNVIDRMREQSAQQARHDKHIAEAVREAQTTAGRTASRTASVPVRPRSQV